MKTLFVYCSDDDTINALCNESALKKRDTKALSLSRSNGKNVFSRCFCVARQGKSFCYSGYDVDVASYEKIIFACDEYLGEIPAEITAFIAKNDLRYKNIDCIVFGNGRSANRAMDSLRVKISLSGGTARNTFCISTREIKREDEDILFSVRHRLAV
ncbi:MAG: hypothetical protein IJ025_05535 [Clostridia bacterium]|nr:hypothetical protein [Clostridia bacterium]